MAVVQTAYPNRHQRYVAGQIVNLQTADIDSMILGGSDNVKFSYGLRRTGERSVELGAERAVAALLNGSANNSTTSLTVDNIDSPWSEFVAGFHYVIEGEIVFVSAVDTAGTSLTVVRGSLGSTAEALSDNAEVYRLTGPSDFLGVAVLDERVKGTNPAGVFTPGSVIPVLHRGDIAVEVSIGVSVGDPVSIRRTSTSTTDPLGSFGNRDPNQHHVQIPGARFLTAAADNGIAVMRLTGEHMTFPIV